MSALGDDELVEVRVMLPRRAIVQQAPAPELVSQASSLELFGLPPRRFLELVRSPAFTAPVLRAGKLRLVRPADLLRELERLDESERAARASSAPPEAPPAPPSIAARLGLEEAPRRRRRTG